jgi:hypothetical protein
MGLDPQKSFAEMNEDCSVENTVGVEVEVLDVVVPHEPLEEVARWEGEPALRESPNIGISSSFFSIGYGSTAAALHMSTSFSRRNPLFSRASKSSVFTFDFFHSQFGYGRGGDTGGDVPVADPEALSRLLFFLSAAFAVLDRDGFILQVHGVFTHIRSGATAVALSGGVLGSTLHSAEAARTGGDFWPRSIWTGYSCVE